MFKTLTVSALLLFSGFLLFSQNKEETEFREATLNGELVNEGLNRCISYVKGWMNYADPASGLIPRNIKESRDYWNAWDAAADNYPFMVLTSSILMPEFFSGKALEMLNAERMLTSRIGKLPDTYSFSGKSFRNEIPDTSQIIFGAAEYMKDGLIPLTEWLGKSPWSDRMLEILDDLPRLVRVVKEIKGSFAGRSAVVEVNGDLLQVLSRMYWFTGKREYLVWAAEIADYYLNDERLPVTSLDRLRIRDHGCEIISGLCEVYLAAAYSWPEKREQWKRYIHSMLDRILEAGRNDDGLFYNEIDPVSGKILSPGIADNFGYTLNAYYFVGMLDSEPSYLEAVFKALGNLESKYRNFNWENGSSDGYADAIEGALNLYNRIPLESTARWLDSEIRVMWQMQKSDGIIEGWHGDGNFARTTVMYCLWKSQGLLPESWKSSLKIGATAKSGILKCSVKCDERWKGKVKFDIPRYSVLMNMPIDYPRINQFQQWYTVDPAKKYEVSFVKSGRVKIYSGKELADGLKLNIKAGEILYFTVIEQ